MLLTAPPFLKYERLDLVPEALRPFAKPVDVLGGPWVVAICATAEAEDLREQLAIANHRLEAADEALTETNEDLRKARQRTRDLEVRVRTDEQYEHEVAKLLIGAGAPEVVHPIERVQWAARRLVETRPISDPRVKLILTIIDNARDDFKDRESWFPMVASRFNSIEEALKGGTILGRDDDAYFAAKRICGNETQANLIDEWFIPPSKASDTWRVRRDILVRLIVEAIEEQTAITAHKRDDLISRLDHVLRGVDGGIVREYIGEEEYEDLLRLTHTHLKGLAPCA